MRASVLALTIAVTALAAGPAAAQQRSKPKDQDLPGLREVQRHRGFWFSLGLGGGWEEFDFDFGNRGRGGAGYVRLGGTVSQQVLLGGEALAWFRDDEFGDAIERVNATFTAMLYPSRHGGWFLKAGGGVAGNNRFGFEETGLGTTFGTGYDLRVGRNFYITPNVDVLVQFFENSTPSSLLFTLGVTWH